MHFFGIKLHQQHNINTIFNSLRQIAKLLFIVCGAIVCSSSLAFTSATISSLIGCASNVYCVFWFVKRLIFIKFLWRFVWMQNQNTTFHYRTHCVNGWTVRANRFVQKQQTEWDSWLWTVIPQMVLCTKNLTVHWNDHTPADSVWQQCAAWDEAKAA